MGEDHVDAGRVGSSRTDAECEAILTEGGVPCSRYYTVRETLAHPHLAERGSFEVIDDGAGPLKVPNPAFKFGNSNGKGAQLCARARRRQRAGAFERAGVFEDRIAALYEKQILHDDSRSASGGHANG